MAPRQNQFKILLSNEELAALRALAEAKGLTASDYVRQLIRREHEPKPKRKREQETR